jgi:hypothetical protein
MGFSGNYKLTRVRIMKKGHGACRRVGGYHRKGGNMIAAYEVRELHLFWRLAKMHPKSAKKSSFVQTANTKQRERG